MKKILMFLFVSVLFSGDGVILTVGDHDVSLHEFFSHYQKKRWENADSLQKNKLFLDFVNIN